MSEFSDLLKQYIKSSGTTVYQLSQTSGVNRTTIQRAISSGRIPQKEAFRRILSVLNLTEEEHRHMAEAYEIASDGIFHFRMRRYIKSFLEKSLTITASPHPFLNLNGVFSSFCPEGRTLVSGRAQIEDTLKLLLSDELHNEKTPEIYLYLPMYEEVFPGFFSVLQQAENAQIRHLICLLKNPEEFENIGFHNLTVLSHILPILLAASGDYRFYYVYNACPPRPEELSGFPYYILFSGYSVLISADFQTAWLESSHSLLNYMKREFSNFLARSKDLAKQKKDPVSYLSICTDLFAEDSLNYTLEYQPCFLPYIDREMVAEIINPHLAGKEIISDMMEAYSRSYQSAKNMIILFTQKGLENFAADGVIPNISPQYARPCNPKERLTLISRIEAAITSDQNMMRCINPAYFKIENQLYFSLQGGEISFFSYQAADKRLMFVNLSENTIFAAFYDFIRYVVDSEYIYSKEETLEIIRKCKKSLEATLL